jgi:hypothetical protein
MCSLKSVVVVVNTVVDVDVVVVEMEEEVVDQVVKA